jgi:hypothetical protein
MRRYLRRTSFLALSAMMAIAVVPAQADPLTFDVFWSGGPFGNSASAAGTIVLESTLLPNPGGTVNYALVLALSVTVSGASAGNGTFTRTDFGFWSWDTGGVMLNLSQELVGQPTPGGPWGTQQTPPAGACCGDLNLFRSNPNAPSGTWWFRLTTAGGQNMALMSMRPSQVPETSTLLLFGVGTLGIFGYSLVMRKTKTYQLHRFAKRLIEGRQLPK